MRTSKRKRTTKKCGSDCNSASEMCSSSSKERTEHVQSSRSYGGRCSKTKSKSA